MSDKCRWCDKEVTLAEANPEMAARERTFGTPLIPLWWRYFCTEEHAAHWAGWAIDKAKRSAPH